MDKANKTIRRAAGFTLLELLLAVTIFSIIAVVLYSTFSAGIKIMRRSEEAMKFHQDLRLVTEELAVDLHNILPAEIHGEAENETINAQGEEEKEPVYFFKGDAKSFTFVTLKDVYGVKGMRRLICDVTYYLERGRTASLGGAGGRAKGALMRTIRYQSQGFAESPDGPETLLRGVEDMEVAYSYEGEDEDSPPLWMNNWQEEEKVPMGVKIKLKLKGLGFIKEYTKTVFIEVGELGIREEDKLPSSAEAKKTGL